MMLSLKSIIGLATLSLLILGTAEHSSAKDYSPRKQCVRYKNVVQTSYGFCIYEMCGGAQISKRCWTQPLRGRQNRWNW